LIHGRDENSPNLKARDLVTTSEVLGVGRRSLSGGTHTILVVFTDKNGREIPELSLMMWSVRQAKTGKRECTILNASNT